MFCFRSMIAVVLILLLATISGTGAYADSPSRSCMVLITATEGGSVQPEGAVTIPCGSDVTVQASSWPGYEINRFLVDGSDAGHNSTILLASVSRDMTVHAIFAPGGGRQESPAPSQPGEGIGLDQRPSSPSIISVGPSGADYSRISDALSHAAPGSTIRIAPGSYLEEITIQKPVILSGEMTNADRPVLAAPGTRTPLTILADNVLIQNLSVAGPDHSEDAPAIQAGGIIGLAVENCVIRDGGNGIVLNHSADLSIRNTTIRNITGTGISLTSTVRTILSDNTIDQCRTGITGSDLDQFVFKDNLVSSNSLSGAYFCDLTGSVIEGNHVAGNGVTGEGIPAGDLQGALVMRNCGNVTISDNELERNRGTALVLSDCTRSTVSGNLMTGNDAGFTIAGAESDPENRVAESNLVDDLPVIYHESESDLVIDNVPASCIYLLNCTHSTVRNMHLKTRNGFGIQVRGGSDLTISSSSVRGNLLQNILIAGTERGKIQNIVIAEGGYGLGLANVQDISVSGALIQNTSAGMVVTGDSGSVTVEWNTFRSNGIGFLAENTVSDIVGDLTANLFEKGDAGISVVRSGGMNITGNEISESRDGFRLIGAEGIRIEDNHVVARNTALNLSAFSVTESSERWETTGTFVTGNTFSADHPIRIDDAGMAGNTLYLNDFITAAQSAESPVSLHSVSDHLLWGGVPLPSPSPDPERIPVSPGITRNGWDTGERVRYEYNGTSFSGYLGNYWGDYHETEIAGSGVRGRPVQIYPGNTDSYPLVRPSMQYHVQGSGYYLDLEKGWNFVAIPSVLKSGSDTAEIFTDVDTGGRSVYSWKNASWYPVRRDEEIKPLIGYWIYSVDHDAVRLVFDPGMIPAPVRLSAGWNAIGFPGIQQAAARDALGSLGDAWEYATGFDADLQAYKEPFLREEGGDTVMFPSQGYWVYMARDWDLQPITG